MKYYRDPSNQKVHGYDETIAAFAPHIAQAIAHGWQDITGHWPPTITQKQTQENISNAITSAINDGAQQWGYYDLATAASYANSTNKQYVADALALIEWRDIVWAWAFPLLATVTPGETAATFLASMPDQPNQPAV